MIDKGLLLQNRYRVVKRLGIGGQCEIWLVDDREQGTRKVLKVLNNDYYKYVELFQREAKILSQLHHREIPKVEADGYFTFQPEGTTEPLHCLVMEFIEGQDLEQWRKDQGNKLISQEQAIDWLKQLVGILAQVHKQNYFHRDIKPSNIMIKPDGEHGELVLIDFGAARKLTDTYFEKLGKEAVTGIYTVGYAAPEQMKGQAVPQSDFFALGRTFVHLLTGKEPKDFQEDPDTYKFKKNWRSSAPQVSKPLADLIDELMARSPKKRPENAQDILQRLAILRLEDSVLSHLEDLPKPLKLLAEPIVKHKIQLWVKNNQVPKIGLYGRSGSGKSSLINAILGEQKAEINHTEAGTLNPKTYNYDRDGWQLTFVDSRGVGDAPDNAASKQAIDYIVQKGINVLLFVIPAQERAYVDNDIKFLKDLKEEHQKKHRTELPVILVINKIDEMPPKREWNPPYNLNIDHQTVSAPTASTKETEIRKCIRVRVKDYETLTKIYVPVCALWDQYNDDRYNIDELALKIYDCIPDEAKPGFAGAAAAKSVKKALANTLTGAFAAAASSICFMPIPVLDAIALFYIQLQLVSIIAQIASDNQDQKETATNFINYLGLYEIGGANVLVNQIAKLIPGIGFALNAGAATTVAALTMILGRVAVGHFIDGISMEEAKQKYNELNARDREKFLEAFMGRQSNSGGKDVE